MDSNQLDEPLRPNFNHSSQDEQSLVPPEVMASPGQVPQTASGEIDWWRPGWHDSVRFIGYRWIFLTPAVLFLVAVAWFCVNRGMRDLIFVIGAKLLMLSAAIAFALAGYVYKRAVRARSEPFCIFCGYNLTDLPDHYRCPECGSPYSLALIAEYRRDPRWFIERYNASKRLPHPDEVFAAGPVKRRRRARDGTE